MSLLISPEKEQQDIAVNESCELAFCQSVALWVDPKVWNEAGPSPWQTNSKSSYTIMKGTDLWTEAAAYTCISAKQVYPPRRATKSSRIIIPHC